MGTTAVKHEIWMFVDERIERGSKFHRFIVGCVVCSKTRWMTLHDEVARIGALGSVRQLDGIRQFLDRLGGFAMLAHADLPITYARPGESDGTDDIPRMTRQDNIWSQAVLAVAAAVLACLRTAGVEAADIDLYYDSKGLTSAHREAWERTLRETLAEIAREDPETGSISTSPRLTFRRVEQVRKRRGIGDADSVQRGTFLADQLCSQAPRLLGGLNVPRVIVRDNTSALRSMVSKFEADPTARDSTKA